MSPPVAGHSDIDEIKDRRSGQASSDGHLQNLGTIAPPEKLPCFHDPAPKGEISANNMLVQRTRSCCQAGMDREALAKLIARSVKKLPDWVRHDLSSNDKAVRIRAEETLTAILAAALEE